MISIDEQLRCFRRPFISPFGVSTVPYRPKDPVPECKEWLAEIGLDPPALVVDIMVCGIVACNMLKGIPGQLVATMVVNCLDGGPGEKAHSLTRCHGSQLVTNTGANSVQKEALKWVVVEGAVCIRHMQEMVARMESCYAE